MKSSFRNLIFLVYFFTYAHIWAQTKLEGSDMSILKLPESNKECILKLGCPISSKDSKKKGALELVFIAQKSNDSIKTFEIRNTTDSIYFAYSGYISPACYHQPYLHQIDSGNRTYYLSLVPTYGNYKMFHPYKNVILPTHQNWYDFIELKPNEYYRFQIRISPAYFSNPENSIPYFDPYKFNEALNGIVNNAKRFKKYQNKYLQIAIYKNIDGLCDSRLRIKNNLNLNLLQKEFFLIKTKFNGFF